jgi:hypothetical protein
VTEDQEARGYVVQSGCPACHWRSEPIPIDPERVNGEWFARRDAAAEYHHHFDINHRPAPRFHPGRVL